MPLIFQCHLTAPLLLKLFACEIVQESFDNINQTERSAVKRGCFLAILCKVLRHQQPINSGARNKHSLISLILSFNKINLSEESTAT